MKTLQTIKVKGGYFSEKVSWKLFEDINLFHHKKENSGRTNRISIIYGCNGSGKSSFTNALYEYIGEKKELRKYDVEFYDEVKNKTTISEKNIFIFNEKYEDDNIKVKKEGIASIALLGSADKIEKSIKFNNDELTKCEEEISSIDLEKQEKRKDKAFDNIIVELRNNWSLREKTIRWLNIKVAVKPDLDFVMRIMQAKPATNITITQLQNKYEKDFSLYKEIKDIASEEIIIPPQIKEEKLDSTICELVNKKLEKPISDELAKLIFDVAKKDNVDLVSTKSNFIEKNASICPYCFQPISSEYKKDLKKALNTIITNEIAEYQKKLNKYEIDLKIENDSCFDVLRNNYIDELNILKQEQITCEHLVNNYNNCIEKKKKNIFSDNKYTNYGLDKHYSKYTKQFNMLRGELIKFKALVDKKDESLDDLQKLNKQITYKEIIDKFKNYQNEGQKYNKLKTRLKELNKKQNDLKIQIDELNGKLSKLEVPLEDINMALATIFSSKLRLRMVLKERKYYIKSRGKDIEPSELSIGERNAISICYFFASMKNGRVIGDEYSSNKLIVMDDPISSFDYGNRIGMLNYLKYMFRIILTKSANSKIIIFSHKANICLDLNRIFSDLKADGIMLQEITANKKLRDIPKYWNSYSNLLEVVYDYAVSESVISEKDLYIGNIMRRVLEAYSSFNYKMGMNKMLNDEKILEKMEDKQLIDYYKNNILSLVINGESHTAEYMTNNFDDSEIQHQEIKEYKKSAKMVLVFLYCMDKNHVMFQLNKPHIEKNINNWVRQIKENSI